MKIIAREITSIDFSRYGKLHDMERGGAGLNLSSGADYTDCHTDEPLLDTPASLGRTAASAAPFSAGEMERHLHSQEAMFCERSPIVFLVAPAGGAAQPNAPDVEAVILRPGQIAVVERGVWHSAAHVRNDGDAYYWSAHAYKGEPTEWQPIAGGPVEVVLEQPL